MHSVSAQHQSNKKRNDNILHFNTRHTIPWKLSCELEQGKDRAYGLEQFSLTMNIDKRAEEPLRDYSTAAVSAISIFS